jgi:hypothetical protein
MAALDDRLSPRPGTDDYAGRQGMAGGAGVPEDQGPRLSLRTLDDAISGRPRSRARTGRGTRMPRRSGAGHGVQDPRPGRGEAAQSAILPGTARSRLCREDGRGAVCLS